MTAKQKWLLIAQHTRLIQWFVGHSMRPNEVQTLGGPDDACQTLVLVFWDACDEAEKRGIKVTTAFVKLARWRMNDLTRQCHVVKPPRSRARREENHRKAVAALSEVLSLKDLIHDWRDDLGQIDHADAMAYLRRRLRQVVSDPRDVDALTMLYGLFGEPKLRQGDVAERLGISRQALDWRMRRAIREIRTLAPELAELL